jgi:hypothetical protein
MRHDPSGTIPAIRSGHHRTPFNRFKLEQLWRTLCLHRGTPWIVEKTIAAQRFSQVRSSDAPAAFEKSRLNGSQTGGEEV